MNGNKATEKWQALINQEDFSKNVLQKILQEAIEREFNKYIGVEKNERSENRNGYRNGHYERDLNLRIGTITLRVCRDREGAFQTQVFDRYQRSEKALVLAIIEMYINGISTRKVTKIMEELCGFEISKSQVSELVKGLDADLQDWRERLLTLKYRYIIFDARYEKVRENKRIVSKASVVAIGIAETGEREVIGCGVFNSESYEAWDAFLQSLIDRGLSGVEYAVTDKNQGLCAALKKHFQGILLQRCQVHIMRNFLGKLAKSIQPEGMTLLKEVFAASTREEAMQRVNKVTTFLTGKKKVDIVDWVTENIEEALAVLDLPVEHRKKMKSTNMLERLNQEIKRRSKVIRIFPNEESCLRLLTAICQDTSESWAGTVYLNMKGGAKN